MECTNPGLLVYVEVAELQVVWPRFCGPLDEPWEPLYGNAIREGWEMIPVRCGHCIGCRIQRSKEWKIRMTHELQMHPGVPGHFITLTYSDENLPPRGSLQRSDLQKFLRSVRKKMGSFRFAACGEYGRQTGRPHYHVITFGLVVSDLRWIESKGRRRFRSTMLEESWGKGFIDIGTAENDSIAYVAGYATKKLGAKRGERPVVEMVAHDGLVVDEFEVAPEFFGASNRPGLGASWVDRYGEQMLRDESIALGEKGKETRTIPRYYLKRLEGHPWLDAFREQRAGNAPLPAEQAQRRFVEGVWEAKLRKMSRDVL